MNRMHIHVSVQDLDKSVLFYSALFGAQPSKTKADYAKWELADPLVNFAISTGDDELGVNHLGIQVDKNTELAELRERLKAADMSAVFQEGETICCYARSDKSWIRDPSGIAWEAYQTMEDVQFFSSADNTMSNS